MNRRWVLWIITVLWALMIFFFSSQPSGQSNQASSNVAKKIAAVTPGLRFPTKEENEIARKATSAVIRKAAHGFLFFALAIFVLSLSQTYPKVAKFAFLISFVICVLYAGIDELHQLSVSGRSGRWMDIAVDSIGAFLGLLNVFVVKKLSPT